MTVPERPDVARVLEQLKDFQRASAEYAFQRMYKDDDAAHRFLIADEVGLGKTLVARGIITKVLHELWDTTDRIDILYICSNGDIARQNVRRLDVLGQEVTPPDRITMLPRQVKSLQGNKVNFIPLTPTTSFSLRSNEGKWRERVLLYWMIREAWGLGDRAAPMNMFQGWIGDADWFREQLRSAPGEFEIDATLQENFAHSLDVRIQAEREEGKPDIRSRFDEVADRFKRRREHENIPRDDLRLRRELVGELRGLLAVSCLEALEPDLIILDEFQRFKELLDPETESGALARGLFEYQHEDARARVLLLSATPYKMYTLAHEADDDHYRDFIQTVRFLLEGKVGSLEAQVRSYRDALLRAQDDSEAVRTSREELERELLRVMIRTERLGVSEQRDGMLREVQPKADARLQSQDLQAYVSVQRLASWMEHPDATEYWKASPYLLSFMESYKYKADLKRWLGDRSWSGEARALLRAGEGLGLPWDRVRGFQDVDPANPRLRNLMADTVDRGAWRLLWVPPSMPYYRTTGAYGDPELHGFTKRLVFGSWVVVPKMLTCLLSYEAERHMIRSLDESPENSPEARARRSPLLMFTRSEGRLTGMPVLAMLYPSPALADIGDPLALAEPGDGSLEREEVIARVEASVAEALRPVLARAPEGGPEDEAWYWAAPILLDDHISHGRTRAWFEQRGLAGVWKGGQPDQEEDSAWGDHIGQARELLAGRLSLGRVPADLTRVVAEVALAAPGNAALRALSRATGGQATMEEPWARNAAATVGWAFRSLFNLPEVMALIRGANSAEPYWRRVVEHCVDGNLQATLDEYAHILVESLGLQTRPREEVAREVAAAMARALSLRTPTLRVDEIRVGSRDVSFEQQGMRGRFALRFQSEEGETGTAATRPEQVREAFNSPFWPFVLATTSVGQEGLDFHQYCHAVVHWNLPSNPVDLEQREGRVHRYKGHAVRKNVAEDFRDAGFSGNGVDPWEGLFAAAYDARPRGGSDIVPFWVYSSEGGAKIERHVPFLPLSRDRVRLEALRRSLAVYRMVFGQPRQEDLVAYLLEHLPPGRIDELMREARIDLTPRPK